MAKLAKCPVCGNKDLGDRWSNKGRRLLEQYCDAIDEDEVLSEKDTRREFHHNWGMWVRVCNWVGEARTPEIQKIRTIRKHGWEIDRGSLIEVFDRFGHTMSHFGGFGDAEAYITKELARGLTDPDAGPYKAVYWKGSSHRGVVYDGSTNPPTKIVPTKPKGVTRLPKHKCDTPRMQLISLVNAVLSGLIVDRDFFKENRTDCWVGLLGEAQDILRDMPEGKWES